MSHVAEKVLNVLQGALAVYDEEKSTFCFCYCPDRIKRLLGYEVLNFDETFMEDALGLLLDEDRANVEDAILEAKRNHIGIKIYSPVREKTSRVK